MMKRILSNIEVSASIFDISPVTIYRLATCLYMVNRIDFVNARVYDRFARAAHASLVGELGSYGNLTGNTHSLLVHGTKTILWCQRELGVPLGWLSEGSIEFGNKLNLAYRNLFSFKGDIKRETKQIFVRRLEMSDPKLIVEGVLGQELREGHVREYYSTLEGRGKRKEKKSSSSSSSSLFPSFQFYSTTATVSCPWTPGGELAARWRQVESASWPRPRLEDSTRDHRYTVVELPKPSGF